MCEYDKENPLKPVKGETARANQALNDFFDMGSARTVASLHRKYLQDAENGKNPPTKAHGTLRGWALKYKWGERIIAQQAINMVLVQEAREKMIVEQQEELNRRIEEQPKIELEDARLLRETCRAILKSLPTTEYKAIKSKDGRIITEIVKPASSAEYNAATRMIEAACKLERLALGMPTSISDHTTGGEKIDQRIIVQWDGDGNTVSGSSPGADGDKE